MKGIAMRTRFALLTACVVATLGALAAPAALAQATYPDRPVKVIIPFPPGGGADVVVRLLQPKMTEVLGQPVIIENRAGAGGNIGTEAAARSAPDGYTVMVATVAQAINHTLTSPPWDLVKDFTPVSLLVLSQSVLAVNPSVPVSSVKELIALAKDKPGALKYASFGLGSSAHMMAELFDLTAGVDMLHVPYKGAPPAINDLLGGQVDLIFCDIAAILPHIKAGKARAIAITSSTRFAGLPGVPTIAEAGLPGYEAGGFLAMIAPTGTPRAAIDKLNAAVSAALKSPEIQERLEGLAGVPMGGTPERAGEFVRGEVAKWAKVIQRANIRPN